CRVKSTDGVKLISVITDDQACRDTLAAQHQSHGRGKVLAVALTIDCEELLDRVDTWNMIAAEVQRVAVSTTRGKEFFKLSTNIQRVVARHRRIGQHGLAQQLRR